MNCRLLLTFALPLFVACATPGPVRQGLLSAEPQASATEGPQSSIAASEEPAATEKAPPLPKATPLAAGAMLGVGLKLDGSKQLQPLQFANVSVKLFDVGKAQRAVNVDVLLGITGTSISKAQPAWGFGGSFELTPGNLPYSVSACTGLAWTSPEAPPAAYLAFNFLGKLGEL